MRKKQSLIKFDFGKLFRDPPRHFLSKRELSANHDLFAVSEIATNASETFSNTESETMTILWLETIGELIALMLIGSDSGTQRLRE